MKNFVKTSVATAVVMGAALIAGSASAGITSTLHNLGTTGTGQNTTTGTGEICVFCHTPHGSDTSAAVPLWNKKLPDNTSFTTYDQLGTSTLDGGITAVVGSVTIACLSCHDGSQAMDNILNAPGSGFYDDTGGGVGGRATADYPWSTGGTVDATGTLTSGIALIGKDLQDDHPVGVQYAGGGYKDSVPGGLPGGNDSDFVIAEYSGALGDRRWWVDNVPMEADTATNGQLDKWDFKLYTRLDGSLSGEDEPFVECGSCHDPHMSTDTFLRIDAAKAGFTNGSNQGSAICLACHAK